MLFDTAYGYNTDMHHLHRQDGFTLVELVVTATFVAMASAAIIGVFITVGKMNKQSRNLAVVAALAEGKLESYRNAGYTAAATGSPSETFTSQLPANLGSPKSAIVNVNTPSTGLKQIDVVITYTDDGKQKKVQLSTLMAQRGINR
jgi:type II secretory pathway pseudopilin PulG